MNTLLTLLIACFSQLDIISHAALLDTLEDTPERADVERQTQAFLSSVLQSILPIIVKGNLRLVCGLVGLLMHGQDIVAIAKSRVREIRVPQFFFCLISHCSLAWPC